MYYTDARDAYYKAGVPRDQKTFFARIGGILCPKCGSMSGFSTLNEKADWHDNHSPYRCAVCQHEWEDV